MMRMRGGGDESQHEQEQENEETAIVLDDEDKALSQTPVAKKEADESMSPPTDRVKRQLSFGSASSAESKQSRLHKFFRSPSSFSDDSSIHETPSPPPKRPRHRMEDTLREMLKSGQLSLDGKKLTLTAHEDVIPKLQQEVGKKFGRFGGRPMKPVSERRGIMGGQKSNRRKANEKPRQFELPVSMKNRICQQIYETRGHHPAEQDMLKAFAKKSKMRLDKLQDIWANRSTWAQLEKKDHGNMIGGEHSKQRPRMRAEGAGAKRQFPEVVQKLGHWLDKERAHGHQVLQRHLAWQYELLLQEHMVELTELLESEKSKDMSTEERQQHEVKLKLAEKQIEAMHGSEKLMNKRAKTLATWLGAETRVPNLVTQISSVEQQVRAELSWQHHDWCIHKVASADEDFMRQYFARPNEITPAIRKACVLGFSDQVPLWLKSGSKKEIMASWEVAGLKKKKQHPHLHEPQQTADETHPAAEEPHEESKAEEPHEESKAEEHHEKQPHEQEEPGDEWKLAMPDEKHEMAHLTTRRQEKADRYRVTFEAMQLVSGFFDHEKTPEGHCMRGILIVPGQHARLDNIDEHGKWKEDETFFYMGQERRHIGGESCGRALISWRKLRDEMPQAFRHFSVMSQPASNSDGICLPWVIKDQARQFPLSVWMRDAYGPAFTSDTVKTLFMGHQVQSSIMPKMTSALQLTDTDFSHAFKASVRRAIDEQSMRQAARRNEEDGHHEQQFPKMGIKEMALAIDAAMEHMIQMNEKTEWVLAGLRRNGFLALRPDEHGKMRKCDHEAWAKDKPLGCKRIHPTWVANRYQHENNGDIEKPNWARIEGATELSDLAHWHYNDGFKDAPSWEDIPFDEHSEPEWQACAKFQMPLDLRRAMLAREATMSDQAKAKRERRREKNKTRRQKKQQEHQLTDEAREELRASMQETSRYAAMRDLPASASKKGKAKAKAKAQAKAEAKAKGMSLPKMGKMAKKQHKKQLKKNALSKAVDELPEPPLPPPPGPPAMSADTGEHDMTKGTWRIVNEDAGISLYGRHGSILGVGRQNCHMLLEKDHFFPKQQKAWVSKSHCERLPEGEHKVWKWAQMSFYRAWKQEMLLDMGLLSQDLDQLDGLEQVHILPYPAIEAGGIELQQLHLGWRVLLWHMLQSSMPCKSMGFISPGWTQPLYLHHDNAKVDVDAFIECIKKQMSAHTLNFLPLGYYDSLPDESQRCRDYAEKILASLLSMGLVHEAVLPPRRNKVFQGVDECGLHVLAAMEQEAAKAMGFGKASTGWPSHSAKKWHERLHKVTNALRTEQTKRLDELKQHKKKEEALGIKMRKEREHMAAMAEKRMSKGLELTALQKMAHEVISQGKVLEIEDMPQAYWDERNRIELHEIGVCSRCRHASGCLSCDEGKLLAYWMRREARRLGRNIAPKYKLSSAGHELVQ
ncbi:unnamed protein product [Symbiodinium sp. CCMP2592]|nr:unnamed protein product [Symbiodinium sp. CCMP2592]